MLDNKNNILEKLCLLGLTTEEAKIYLELFHEPQTHLRLSRITGINRTKVYRLIENLEKKHMVSRRTDDRGTFLIASEPTSLKAELITREEQIKQQHTILEQLIPQLQIFPTEKSRIFTTQTYEGIEGLKQMIWNELSTKGELLSLGGQAMEDLVDDHRWTERHRAMTVRANYSIREIINHGVIHPAPSSNINYLNRYSYREMPKKEIVFNEQIIIYNDTVSLYHWRENQKVGIEIVSKTYSNTMRQTFEHYWQLAEER